MALMSVCIDRITVTSSTILEMGRSSETSMPLSPHLWNFHGLPKSFCRAIHETGTSLPGIILATATARSGLGRGGRCDWGRRA